MADAMNPSRLHEAGKNQLRALDPHVSVWVGASAGAGKTDVLTRRMLSLLLADPTLHPREILALTFTRAGAAEMAERLPAKLRAWCSLDEEKLALTIQNDLGLAYQPAFAARVRELAYEALREPAMIATIHGLGQTLLAQFPLEAGVPMGFELLDESEKARLLLEIQNSLLTSADGALAEQLGLLLDFLGEYGWREMTGAILFNWRKLREVLEGSSVVQLMERIRTLLGLRGGEEWALGPLRILDDEWRALQAVAAALPDHDAVEVLNAGEAGREAAWRLFLLTKDDSERKIFTKKLIKAVGEETCAILQEAQRRIAEQVRLRAVLDNYRLTEALVVWAFNVKAAYHARKHALGLLDFDDLLDGLERLLGDTSSSRQDWLWYVLDRRFCHLLVDEAQDNNPQQDRVIGALAASLLAGDIGNGKPRSVMAVGDVKQCVFRFQGSAPELFLNLSTNMQLWAGANFKQVELRHNFRSGAHVLAAVDEVFAAPELAHPVMGAEMDWANHVAVRASPSRVELWPLVGGDSNDAASAPSGWLLPAERLAAQVPDNEILCYRKIGAWLHETVARAPLMPSTGKPLGWGDVMILVGRNEPAARCAGVLRGMGIPVAAAAGVVPACIDDAVALLRAVFNPADRVAVASALKGWRGWSDVRILDLVRRAGDGPLSTALEGEDARWFAELRGMATLPPVRLLQQALTTKPLGPYLPLLEWAEEASSLAELVARLEREDVPVASGGAGVKIMTVHKSKGLQAPLVVLTDTVQPLDGRDDKIWWGEGALLVRRKDSGSDFEQRLKESARTEQRADKLRGLYVAMTRAGDWLVVTGWEKKNIPDCWWKLVEAAAHDNPAWRDESGVLVRGDAF